MRILSLAVAVALSLCFTALTARGNELPHAADLQESFIHPPDSARPWVYWFWMDGNVTRAGITADLEAMQRVGIGGVLLMDVSQGLPRGSARFNGPEWQAFFEHAVSEATRLGLELTLHNSVGWTGSGGPWVTPDLAMQRLMSTKTNVTGPIMFTGQLPFFAGQDQRCTPVASLAYPSVTGDGGASPGFPPKLVTISGKALDEEKLFDHNPSTFVSVPIPGPHRSEYLQLEFAQRYSAASLKLTAGARPQQFRGILQVSDDGAKFRDVREFVSKSSGLSLVFEPIKARFFRLLFTSADPGLSALEFSELELEPVYRIPWYQSKSGAGPMPTAMGSLEDDIPSGATIDPTKVLDLTGQIDSRGTLTWQVPEGTWSILRLFSVPIGTATRGATTETSGLECDKLSSEAIESHFDYFVGQLASKVGTNSAFRATHIDSWEIGFQNWTPRFREEFKTRRGYDPLPYLPTFTGRFVGDPKRSERFLWDVRRTIADLVADNYFGALANLAHRRGLSLSAEAYPSLGKAPFDELQCAGRADVPMAEFWFGTNDLSNLDLRAMPSAAHTSGKRIVACESFTSEAAFSKWQEHPAALKPLADAAFCEGINRLVIHRYAHQPWLDRAPGMTMGPFGLHYERTQTWWEQSRPWHDYLARCQYLLQQGTFVADICYLTSETPFSSPPAREQLEPPIPPGYSYDLIHPEVFLKEMSVKDGRFVLPNGMSYQVLIVPRSPVMTPELLLKIKELIAAGGNVVLAGPRLANSPSLAGYPECDERIKHLASDVWGPGDGQTITQRELGKGTVFFAKSLQQVLATKSLSPDFQLTRTTPEQPLHWIHRRTADAEIYFVVNSNPHSVVADCRFRVSNKVPEIWRPDTGQTEPAAMWRQGQGGTTVAVHLDACGSAFVIFRHPSAGVDAVTAINRNGEMFDASDLSVGSDGVISLLASRPATYSVRLASGRNLKTRVDAVPAPIEIPGPWDLAIPIKSSAPVRVSIDHLVSWTTLTNPAAKFFSGTATYQTRFNVPGNLINSERDFVLSLGNVQVIAALVVNKVDFGVLWKPPFQANITKAIKPGSNVLEIKVTNLWPNRLIGDESLPEDCTWQQSLENDSGYPIAEWPDWLLQDKPSPSGRTTFTTWKQWHKDARLIQSGLLGPVTLRIIEQRTLR